MGRKKTDELNQTSNRGKIMSPNTLEEQLRQVQITKQLYKKKIIELTDYENELLKQIGGEEE